MLARKSNGISLCGLPTEHAAFLSISREETEAQTPPLHSPAKLTYWDLLVPSTYEH